MTSKLSNLKFIIISQVTFYLIPKLIFKRVYIKHSEQINEKGYMWELIHPNGKKNVSNKISFVVRNETEIEKWEHNQLHSSFCLFEKKMH